MITTPGQYDRAQGSPDGGQHTGKSRIERAGVTHEPGPVRPYPDIESSVHESTDGGYHATFGMETRGLDYVAVNTQEPRVHARCRAQQTLHRLLKHLGPGEAIEFCYGWHPGTANQLRFHWQVQAVGAASSHAETVERVRCLYESLELALGVSGYGLAMTPIPGDALAPDRSLPWQCDLGKHRLWLPADTGSRRAASGAIPLRSNVVVSVAFIDEQVAFDSILRAEPVRTQAFEVRVRLEPFKLSDDAIDWLKRLHDAQRFGGVGTWYHDDGRFSRPAQTDLAKIGVKKLDDWVSDRAGYRTLCSGFAERPLPPAFLESIGRDLFSTRSITLATRERRAGATAIEHAGGIDLADCFAVRRNVPSLLPTLPALTGAGMPVLHGETAPDMSASGLVLGHVGRPGALRAVRWDERARRQHGYVIGATGTGKSTLLLNAAVQDIHAGRGVCVIDPQSDLCKHALDCIPTERERDTILLDFSDFARPVGINLLEKRSDNPAGITYIVNGLISILHRLYASVPEAMGPMFETYMRNALTALIDNTRQPATLPDVVRMFENSKFRARILDGCRSPQTVSFWREQAERAGGDAALRNITTYITSKLNRFTNNEILRPILGQATSTFDLRCAMDEGAVVLVNLAKGRLGSWDAQLLGLLLVDALLRAAAGRQAIHKHERRRFYVYIDDAQNLIMPETAALLAEGRDYGLSCVLASQSFAQLTTADRPRLLQTMLSDIGSLICFRTGPADAEYLADVMAPAIAAADLQHLPNHQAACCLLGGQAPIQPFVCRTLAAPEPRDESSAVIRQRARTHHARPRQAVEASIRGSENA